MTRLKRLMIRGALALLLSSGAAAHAVEISDAWVRATPPGARLSAGFLTLTGDPEQSDRLLSASTPGAGAVEIHESRMDGDIMRMRALPDGVEIAAGEQVTLAPGGIHLMLLNLDQPLQAGEEIALTLHFEHAGVQTVQARIRPPGAGASEHHHH